MAEDDTKSRIPRKLLLPGGLVLIGGIVVPAAFWLWDVVHPEGSRPDTPVAAVSANPELNDPRTDPRAPAERTTILRDLKLGAKVSGWTIEALTLSSKPDMKGSLAVLLSNGKKSFVVWIMPRATMKLASPHGTDGYTFHPGMYVEMTAEEGSAPLDALVKEVRAFEGSPEPPPSTSACPPSASASASAAPSGAAAASAGPPGSASAAPRR